MVSNIIYSEHHYIIYSTGFCILYITYFIVDNMLKKTNNKYRNLDKNKQFYIVSNILKSLLLGTITPFAAMVLYQTMCLDHWNNNLIKNIGIIYAIPDGVSLTLVRKMDMTTKIHHTIVCIFNIISINNNYEEDNIVRCMVIYACFSCFAFIVNLLLGVRFLHDSKRIGIIMAKASLYIYMTCCLINWAWHGKYVHTLVNKCDGGLCQITIPSYCAMIMMLAWDDIKLNKWLYKESYKQIKDE